MSAEHLSLRERIVKNLSWQVASQGVQFVLGLATVRILTGALGKTGYGKFSFLFYFIYFFQTLSDLGLNTVLVRDLAKAPERTVELVRQTLGLRVALSVTAMVAAWTVAAFYRVTLDERRAIDIFALILPIQALSVPGATLQAQLRIPRAAIIEIANRVSGFAFMMAALWMGHRLIGVTVALVCGEMVGLTGVIVTTRHLVTPIPSFDTRRWRAMLTSGLPLGCTVLLVALVNRADFWMLQWMLPENTREVEIAYYGAAYKVPQLVERIPLLLMVTLLPVMARLAATDPLRLRQLYRRTVLRFALLAVPMAALVVWLAPVLIGVLCAPGFDPAVPMLRLLIWSSAFVYVAVVAGNLLIALGHQQASLRAWIIAAPLNMGLNVLLIPRYGARGAALSTSVSFLVVLVVVLVLAEHRLRELVDSRALAIAPSAGDPSRVH